MSSDMDARFDALEARRRANELARKAQPKKLVRDMTPHEQAVRKAGKVLAEQRAAARHFLTVNWRTHRTGTGRQKWPSVNPITDAECDAYIASRAKSARTETGENAATVLQNMGRTGKDLDK